MTKDWQALYKEEFQKRKQANETWKSHYTNVLEKYKQSVDEISTKNNLIYQLTNVNKNIVSALVNMIELGLGVKYNAREVADHSLILAISMQLPQKSVDDLYFAAQLHDIGGIFLPKDILNKPIEKLNIDKINQLKQIPWLSHMALIAIEPFKTAGDIILAHQEKLDGSGYPKQLKGRDISIEAQILGVVVDYYKIIHDRFIYKKTAPDEFKQYFEANKDKLYDARIVDKFMQILDLEKNQATRNELQVENRRLEPGMILSRHLYSSNQMLVLPKHHVLTDDNIEALTNLEIASGEQFKIFVKRGKFEEVSEVQKTRAHVDANIQDPDKLSSSLD